MQGHAFPFIPVLWFHTDLNMEEYTYHAQNTCGKFWCMQAVFLFKRTLCSPSPSPHFYQLTLIIEYFHTQYTHMNAVMTNCEYQLECLTVSHMGHTTLDVDTGGVREGIFISVIHSSKELFTICPQQTTVCFTCPALQRSSPSLAANWFYWWLGDSRLSVNQTALKGKVFPNVDCQLK